MYRLREVIHLKPYRLGENSSLKPPIQVISGCGLSDLLGPARQKQKQDPGQQPRDDDLVCV